MKEKGILGLKRVLGLKEVVAIGIGQTIGAGVFAMTGIAIGMCGTALPIAYMLAVIPVIFLMLPLIQLGAAIPTVGGNYTYPSRLVSPFVAFMGIWIIAIGHFMGAFPLYTITMVEYLRAFFPNLDITIAAVAILTIFYLINLLGISLAAVVQGVMVLIMISALVMYSAVGLPHVSLSHFENLFPMGGLSLLSATALLTFPYLGSNAIIELGGEIKRPERTIPISFLIIFPMIFIIYVTMSFVAVGVTGWEVAADKTLTESARAFLSGAALNYFIIGGALLAITTTLNASFMWGTKSLMVIAKDGLLPEFLTRVNKRFGTPHYMLTILWLIPVIAIICKIPIKTFAIYASIGGLVVFIPVMIAGLLLKKKMPDKYKASPFKIPQKLLVVCVVIGILLFIVAIFALISELWTTSQTMTFVLLEWIFNGLVYYYIMKTRMLKKGVDFKKLTKKLEF